MSSIIRVKLTRLFTKLLTGLLGSSRYNVSDVILSYDEYGQCMD